MKTTQAWGWLASGVLALGLNGVYQDEGTVWVHRNLDGMVARIADRSGAVLALATGRTDWFMAKANLAAARNEGASCRVAAAVSRFQARMTRTQTGMAQFEAMSAREQAQLARLEANRARLEAQVARIRFIPADFKMAEIPPVCPRVRVKVRLNLPQPQVKIPPDVHVEAPGTGPV